MKTNAEKLKYKQEIEALSEDLFDYNEMLNLKKVTIGQAVQRVITSATGTYYKCSTKQVFDLSKDKLKEYGLQGYSIFEVNLKGKKFCKDKDFKVLVDTKDVESICESLAPMIYKINDEIHKEYLDKKEKESNKIEEEGK